MKLSSKDKILMTSMKLFMEKGYKKTTTKLIASEAGVNEVTVFRLFGKKRKIIEDIMVLKLMDIQPLSDYFSQQVTFDIQEDLYESSMVYYRSMIKNLPLMMSLLDELGDDFGHLFSKLPKKVISIYSQYFELLKEKKLIGDYDSKTLGKSFNTLISGIAMTKALTKDSIIDETDELFIKTNVEIFSRGILRKVG
ncbi:TetR/AcrR family transcriptional regulator [Acidaminobacter sp. JC074]|uniref:TetR/AcrR family transcriptional regulator n=1 Tax=Acidaminobacter sp. JC074 TaxID=2530199 RepID=UPI001F0D8CB7|nr:TetR/AcrR family transcriptional regulator [Acidaminobacter sp. JC074]MCH4889672.1 TetR/AcrR family transcriptional regulator [Acidaminobacter sp. JC074]